MTERRSTVGLSSDRQELLALLMAEEGVEVEVRETVPRRKEASLAPLSFSQQRLWFLDQMEPESPLYNVFTTVLLEGELDAGVLERVLVEVERRHDVLRSTFQLVDGEPVQVVAAAPAFSMPCLDLTSLPPAARLREARRQMRLEVRRPFDLARGPVLRALRLCLEPRRHGVVLTLPHIVSDLWSRRVLLREIRALYAAFAAGRPSPLSPLPIQYGDYAAWQRDNLSGERLAELVGYWRRRLEGAPVLHLPTDRPRPAQRSWHGRHHRFVVEAELTRPLRRLAEQHGATLFMTLLAVFQALLRRLSGARDFVVGTPIANRDRPEVEDLIGFFVNTLPLRCDLRDDPAFADLVERSRDLALEAYAHQDVPFEKLLDELGVERDLSTTPLFQVALVLQNVPFDRLELTPDLRLTSFPVDDGTSKFDLTLTFEEAGETLAGTLEYSTDLFDATTAERWRNHLRTLLRSAVERPGEAVSRLACLSPAECHQLLREWRCPTPVPSPSGLLHGRFEEQARGAADAVAVLWEEERLSYGELDRRAGQLASRLRQLGVGPEVRVGVCLERSAELIVALLAVLKAGGAYVPLDPAYPPSRLSYLLEDSQAPVLVSRRDLDVELPAGEAVRLWLDADAEEVARQPHELPAVPVAPDNAAYVIYTSGSTGRPKGVVVTHADVLRLFDATAPWFGFDAADVWTMFHSYAFDFSVWEIWGALLYGGKLAVVPYLSSRSPELFRELLARHAVTVLNQTPSAFRQLIRADADAPEPLSLRLVIFGGEALEPRSLLPWVRRYGAERPRLVNMYGITETTVHVTYRPLSRVDVEEAGGSPIGVPIPDLEVAVLDPRMEPQAIGVPGELYVGGAGLARGYLDRPALTAERFVPHPTGREPGGRLYRSGDVGRFLPDGSLEHLGRADQQVKVRGFRIEPGEVEAALHAFPGISEVAVLARRDENGDGLLVAYFVAVAGAEPSVSELRDFLRRRLPEHMVPAAFVALASLPLTAHGKVDRDRLPAPSAERSRLRQAYVPPRNPVEDALTAIWGQALGLDRVGIHDNFFELGGDSIRSVRVMAQARERGFDLSLQQLFRHQTIAELAPHLGGPPPGAYRPIAPFELIRAADRARLGDEVEDAYPLSALQAGILYHMERSPRRPLYHNVNSYHLGAPFEPSCFAAAVAAAVERHPILRTSFDLTDYGEPLQLVHREAPLPLGVADLRGLDEAAQKEALAAYAAAERQRRFDLSRPPLLRFQIHRRSDESFQLTLTLCHAILDGWSLQSTLAEIFDHYLTRVGGGRPAAETPIALGFRDFVHLEREALRSAECRGFWREKLRGASLLELPPPPPSPTGRRIRRLHLDLPEDVSAGLVRCARDAGLPLKSVLLAIHCRVLGLMSGRDDVLGGLAVHGRPEERDGERIRGLFMNSVPFRLRLRPGTWLELARSAFETEMELLPHRRYPLAAIQGDVEMQPVFETQFNYVHFHVLEDTLREQRVKLLSDAADLSTEETHYALLASFGQDVLDSRVYLHLYCDRARFSDERIDAVADYYRRALQAVARGPEGRHEAADLLSADEHRQLVAWSETPAEPPAEPTVVGLLAAQVARAPEAPALVWEGGSLSYGELAASSDLLARRLAALGVGPEVPVGLHLERGPELVVAVLAALKAGGAYLPLEPTHPQERLSDLLATVRPPVVVGAGEAADRLAADPAAAAVRWLRLDAGWQEAEAAEAEPRPADGDHLAYLLFTSGSTGRPKGVMVPHRGLAHYLSWAAREYGAHGGAPLHSSVGFDLTVTSLLAPLVCGGRITLVSEEAGVQGLAEALRGTDGFGMVKLTPSHLEVINRLVPGEELTGKVGALVIGGEALWNRTLKLWHDHAPGTRLINEYGPTETTVACTLFDAAGVEVPGEGVPIGRPLPGYRVHLLDSGGRRVPVGARGEVFVGGTGVTRGYLGRPVETATRFVPDPFGPEPGGRLYRTGDLARRQPGGDLDYLGRVDDQVKIRGHRVELGEVEAVLGEHPAVREAAVMVRGETGAEAQLVAYVVVRDPAPQVEELRRHLARRLPDPMLPRFFVALEALPLTANGKVDRRALPAPEGVRAGAGTAVAPRNPTEEVLCGIWSEVLKVEGIGVHDDFFQLGGHSLFAVQVISRVRRVFHVELELEELFNHPTIAALAESVDRLTRRAPGLDVPRIEPAPRDAPLPLSFAQQRLWFLDRLMPGSAYYNLTTALRLEGELRAGLLERCLSEVVRRHEVLRTTFVVVDDRPVQKIAPPRPIRMRRFDLSRLAPAAREAELRRLAAVLARQPFDLSTGPLLRVALLRLGPHDHVALLTQHHVVSDDWSRGILVREVSALYEAFAAGRPSPLAELEVQYADFAVWQRRYLTGPVLQAQVDYWREHLAGAPAWLELPTDRPRPAVQSDRGTAFPFELSAGLSESIQLEARRQGVTPFMWLLTAFGVLLSRWSGQDDVLIGSPIANRNQMEVEGLIGFFVNSLALRVTPGAGGDFAGLLGQVRERTLGAYAHQDLPFERLVDALDLERDASRQPLFQVMFSLANAPRRDLELPGLRLSVLPGERSTARFDLTVVLEERGSVFFGILEYNTDLFDASTAERFLADFRGLLDVFSEDSTRPWTTAPSTSEAARHQLLHDARGPAATVPVLGRERPELTQSFVPPRGELERTFAEIWCRTLGLEQVGIEDNFFDLGGDSLLLVQIHRYEQEAVGREFPLTLLFQHPTIGGLVRYLQEAADGTQPATETRATARAATADTRRRLADRRRDLRKGGST